MEMIDRKKVIKAIDGCINDDSFCNKCDYDGCVFKHGDCRRDLLADALALLKEQEGTINELQNAYEYLQKQFFEVQDKLLKEQEAVVRCRDCKHKEESVSPSWEAWCNRLHCGCDNDWFCADGERKDEP